MKETIETAEGRNHPVCIGRRGIQREINYFVFSVVNSKWFWFRVASKP